MLRDFTEDKEYFLNIWTLEKLLLIDLTERKTSQALQAAAVSVTFSLM
jgi:hypothetical protein